MLFDCGSGLFGMKRVRWGWCFFVLLLMPAPAWAYGDPNSAGLLYQMLVPLLAVAMFGIRRIAQRTREAALWAKRLVFRDARSDRN